MFGKFNLIVVFDCECRNILMCKRRKEPYKGMYNFVGGKIEDGENGLDSAYRELQEETGILQSQIRLKHIMDFVYYLNEVNLEVYAGRVKTEVSVFGIENELEWINLDQDFFDSSIFAGDGNIGHIMKQIYLSKDTILI